MNDTKINLIETVSTCPYCESEISKSSELKFCIKCERQVKCLKCEHILFKNKSICLSCGFSLQDSQSKSVLMNTFSLQEKQSEKGYSRNINLSFTNETASTVASTVSGYVPFFDPSNRQQTVYTKQQKPLLPSQVLEETTENTEINVTSNSKNNIEKQTQHDSEVNDALKYFEQDENGFLVSKTRDYKGKNKKLQQQRFISLYVWGYKLLLHNSVSKEHLYQAAKINGIYDKNYSNYLQDTVNSFFVIISSSFKLNPAGKDEVYKIISEIEDDNLKGFEYWNPKKRNSSPRTKKEDKQKIEGWCQKPSRFDNNGFDVRTVTTARDLAILAIYDITKELQIQESIKPGLSIDYLLKRYPTISKGKKTIKVALSNKNYSNYFGRTDNGGYYLTPEAEKLAESWL